MGNTLLTKEEDKQKARLADDLYRYAHYRGYLKYKPKVAQKSKKLVVRNLLQDLNAGEVAIQDSFAVKHLKDQIGLDIDKNKTFLEQYASNWIGGIGICILFAFTVLCSSAIVLTTYGIVAGKISAWYLLGPAAATAIDCLAFWLLSSMLQADTKNEQRKWRQVPFADIPWEPSVQLAREVVTVAKKVKYAEFYIEYLPIELPKPKYYFVIVKHGEEKYVLGKTPQVKDIL